MATIRNCQIHPVAVLSILPNVFFPELLIPLHSMIQIDAVYLSAMAERQSSSEGLNSWLFLDRGGKQTGPTTEMDAVVTYALRASAMIHRKIIFMKEKVSHHIQHECLIGVFTTEINPRFEGSVIDVGHLTCISHNNREALRIRMPISSEDKLFQERSPLSQNAGEFSAVRLILSLATSG